MADLTIPCILAVLCALSCVPCVSPTAIQDGIINWDPLPPDPEYKTMTEEPSLPLSSLFGLATGFIHLVPPQEIPWGKVTIYSYIVRVFFSSTRNLIGLLVKFIQDALCIIRH